MAMLGSALTYAPNQGPTATILEIDRGGSSLIARRRHRENLEELWLEFWSSEIS